MSRDTVEKLEARLLEIEKEGNRVRERMNNLNRSLLEPELEQLRRRYKDTHERWLAAKAQEALF